MKKRFMDTEAWKILRTALEFILLVVLVCGVIFLVEGVAHMEEYPVMYAICSKGDRVNVRPFANTGNEPVGWLEPGDPVYLDGQKKNGFYHCVGLNTEMGSGWVHRGYLVSDPPELINRTGVIATRDKVQARKNVGGKRIRWLKPGGTVKISYWTEEWCVTDCGYVMSKLTELDGE